MSVVDPYAEAVDHGPVRFLHRLNPLAKAAGPIPAMVFVFFTRDILTPAALLALALLTILVGAALRWRGLLGLLLGFPVGILVFSLSFGLWSDPSLYPGSPSVLQLGQWHFTIGQWWAGLATAMRLAAVLALALIAGVSTTGVDLTRAMVQQLHVPYRIGYTALAAFRFVPRFRTDLETIRAAHRVRGMTARRGPIAAAGRWFGYIVPLLAGGIRHAERVALSMDGRGFGYAATRTERHVIRWRARDWAFTLGYWVLSAAIVTVALLIRR